MTHSNVPLSCRCGALKGAVGNTSTLPSRRIVCYCDDCRRASLHLEPSGALLDEGGGTDIWQVTPNAVTFSEGQEHLRLLRLSPKGLFRWYAGCCNTPLANTMSSPGFAFVGVPVNAIGGSDVAEAQIGPVQVGIYGKSATGPTCSGTHESGSPKLLLGVVTQLISSRVRGHHRPSPFFDDAGAPVVSPEIAPRDAELKT
ncbi:MAG: hypothetical protein ACI81R_001376 [Bradymonadia bacterium]|jgi:hypothetical protein